MSDYPSGSSEDRKMLASMTSDKLLDYTFLLIRNLWRIDGLYFLGIEKKFGTQAATEIDAGVWEAMGSIEAKNMQKLFEVSENPDAQEIVDLLQKSSWALDQPFKTIEKSRKKSVLAIDRCRTQETRLAKGLSEFPCKSVRYNYLKNFAKTLNPKAKVNCIVCPPDKHSKDSWCKWEFTL
jgi:hypothetical protein